MVCVGAGRPERGRDDDPAPTEAGIEAAVRVVPRHRDVEAAGVRPARGKQLAVALNGEIEHDPRRDRRDYEAVPVEARVERPVGQVSRDGELSSRSRASRRDDLAVGLDEDGARAVDAVRLERRQHLASVAEGAVQRAVAVVPRQSEVERATLRGKSGPGRDDLSVRLDHDVACTVGPSAEVGRDLAIPVEGCVKGATRRVASEDEVVRGAGVEASACEHRPSVRLHGETQGCFVPAEVGSDLAARAKGRVEVASSRW
jgi:hypothetical protein